MTHARALAARTALAATGHTGHRRGAYRARACPYRRYHLGRHYLSLVMGGLWGLTSAPLGYADCTSAAHPLGPTLRINVSGGLPSSTLVRCRKAGSSPLSGLAGRVTQPGGHTVSDSATEATRASPKSASPVNWALPK